MTPRTLVWRMSRARTGTMDPGAYASRSKTFGSAVRDLRGATLLTVRTRVGVECYMLTPGRRPDLSAKAADVLAHAVGAKAEPEDGTPDLSGGPVVARLVARPNQSASRDAQAGADPTEVAQTIARTAEPGSWLAVTLRRPKGKEIDRTREWNHRRHASYTHHSLDSEVLVASFWAGAPSESSANFLLGQVVAALPGMDVDVVTKVATDRPLAIGAGVLAGLAVAGGAAGELWLPGALTETSAELATTVDDLPMLLAGLGVAVPSAVTSVLAGRHLLPTAAQRNRRMAEQLTFPPPPAGGRAAPRPRPPEEGKAPEPPPNPYPLAPTSFLVGPSVVAGVVAPQGGAEAGAASTGMRGAPPALLEDIGPMVGTTGTGQKVHISSEARHAGVMVLGIPDSGKSVAIRALYAWNVLDRVCPSDKPGRPGRDNTLIAFENKGEGAGEYMAWGQALGDHPLRVDLADRDTPAIDLFAGPASPRAKAKQVAEGMMYAFPHGSIQRQSLSTITLVLTAAQYVDDQVAEWAELPPGRSVVEHAATLLGSDGDTESVLLATALTRAAMLDGADQGLREAAKALAPMFGEKVTAAQRRGLQDAPRTKVETLVEAKDWFAPDRPKLSWADILTTHDNVVVNTGISATGTLVSADLTSVMGSMLLFTLKDAIMRTCSGWKDDGRTVSLFVDELALLAADSPEVVTWFRNQGRSYGVAQYLATQYPDQLVDEVRKAVLSFGTIYWFRQSNPAIASMAAEALSVDGSEWRASDIYNLPAHTAVITAQVDKAAQPAVPVRLGWWEPERESFHEVQDYPAGLLPAPERHPVAQTDEETVPEPEPELPDDPGEIPVPAPEYDGDPFDPDRFGA